MIENINLKNKNGKIVKGKLKLLDESYIDKIMNLQEEINRGLEVKSWYSATSKEEFIMDLKGNGKIIGCLLDDDTLIALGTYVQWGYEEHNYGYDLKINRSKLLDVGQIEATLVREDFRGNALQQIICSQIENIARENNNSILAVTVHPDNIYSLKTFINLGYEVKLEKLKYGNLRRFVLQKYIV